MFVYTKAIKELKISHLETLNKIAEAKEDAIRTIRTVTDAAKNKALEYETIVDNHVSNRAVVINDNNEYVIVDDDNEEVIDKLDNLSIDELVTIIKTIRENGLDKDRNSNDNGDI